MKYTWFLRWMCWFCSDLKVKVAGENLSAHKFVLAARSDVWSLANLATTSELDLTGEQPWYDGTVLKEQFKAGAEQLMFCSVVLQRCPGRQILASRCKKTCLLQKTTSPTTPLWFRIVILFSGNENRNVQMIICINGESNPRRIE